MHNISMSNRLSEQELQALLHKYLPSDSMPVAMGERLQQTVLAEVNASINLTNAVPPIHRSTPRTQSDWWSRWVPRFHFGPRLAFIGISAVVLLLAVTFTRQLLLPLTTLSAIAEIQSGTALVVRKAGEVREFVPSGSSLQLAQGDQLMTQSATARVRYSTGQSTQVEPDGHIEIQGLTRDTAGNPRVVVMVHKGRTYNETNAAAPAGARLEVRTPSHVTIVANGGNDTFVVQSLSMHESYLATIAGEVDVEMEGQHVEVQAASQVFAVSGQPLVVEPTTTSPVPTLRPVSSPVFAITLTPPTRTPTRRPTATNHPRQVSVPTATQAVPAATHTATRVPTATNVPSIAPATPTLVPTWTSSPTIQPTFTSIPVATNTPVPPQSKPNTPTATPVPPTATPIPPTATPTNTPAPSPTNTPSDPTEGGTIPPRPTTNSNEGGTIPPSTVSSGE